MSDRPNILLIHSDQHRYDCVGANGHPLVRTPALDGLARAGTNFSHAFTPIAICSPARASLMTGAWPTQHGCLLIPYCCETFNPAADRLPVLTTLLAGAGYANAWVGKFHSEVRGVPQDHGVGTYIDEQAYGKWRAAQGLPPAPRGSTVDTAITPEQSRLKWGADHVIDLLGERAGRQPFFVRWDPSEPHLPNIPPEPYASLYRAADIAPWPSFPDPFENKPHALKKMRTRWGLDGYTWEQFAPKVALYLAEITLLDAQIARVLAALDELGVAANTLVIYSTDHGDLCGAHGLLDKHYNMYDDIMHVPLIVRWPGVLPAGAACDAFTINELDIATTLLHAAGVTPPDTFRGRDLIVAATGRDAVPRQEVFAQYFGTHQGLYSSRMVRDRRYKYVYNATAEDELYDLQTDRGELHNLIDDPAEAAHRERLKTRLTEWMTALRDPLNGPLFASRAPRPAEPARSAPAEA